MDRLTEARAGGRLACASCATELAPDALACPVCATLVHAAALRELAAQGDQQEAAGAFADARATWERALGLLPASSRQHEQIRARIADLTKRLDATPLLPKSAEHAAHPWWKRWGVAAAVIAVFALGKLKFLLLGLTKAKTFLSMFAFFGVYWSLFGWALAAGIVVSIYIHEMGHVAALKRLGLAGDAPLFIPGVGAFILMRSHIDDPAVDAKIGLAGPLWGLGAGLAAFAMFQLTDLKIWAAIAQVTGFINLFNLIPVWQLDGARGFHALSVWQRWMVVGALAAAFALTGQRLLLLVGAVAVWKAFRPAVPNGNREALATFVLLIAALGWLSSIPVL